MASITGHLLARWASWTTVTSYADVSRCKQMTDRAPGAASSALSSLLLLVPVVVSLLASIVGPATDERTTVSLTGHSTAEMTFGDGSRTQFLAIKALGDPPEGRTFLVNDRGGNVTVLTPVEASKCEGREVKHSGLPDSQVWCFKVTRESRTAGDLDVTIERPGPQAGSLVSGMLEGQSTTINLTLARRHNFFFGPLTVMFVGAILSMLVIWNLSAKDELKSLDTRKKAWFYFLAATWSAIVLLGVYSVAYEAKPTFGTSGDYLILLTGSAGAAGLAVVVNLVRAGNRVTTSDRGDVPRAPST